MGPDQRGGQVGGHLLQVDGSRRSVLADGALENVFSIVLPLCTNRAMV